jgi:hypothetical protein
VEEDLENNDSFYFNSKLLYKEHEVFSINNQSNESPCIEITINTLFDRKDKININEITKKLKHLN